MMQDPTEDTATWSFKRPRIMRFNLKDTRSAQGALGKKLINNDGRDKTLNQLFLKFESLEDCAFAAEVTFPEEEDH